MCVQCLMKTDIEMAINDMSGYKVGAVETTNSNTHERKRFIHTNDTSVRRGEV